MKKKTETVENLECPRAGFCVHVDTDCNETSAESRDFGCFENNNVSAGIETSHDGVMADGEISITEESVFVCGETSSPFKRFMPVELTEEELAEQGAEMARLIGIWTKAKLDKKAFDKSIKSLIDTTEEKYIEIAAIVDAAAEEREVDCYWQFDSKHALKRLYRCDTGEMVEEAVMDQHDLQRDFNWQAQQSEANVNAMAQEATQGEESEGTGSEAQEANSTTAENLFDGPESDSGASMSQSEDAL